MNNRIKYLREQKGISQTALAQYVGVVRSAMCQYENGSRQIPDSTKIKLADYFGISVDYLLGRADEPNPNNQLTNTQPNLLPELLVQLDSLSLEQQEKVVAFIKGLLA